MKNKDQVLIVPTTYVSHIGNNFVGTSLTTERSYCLYDSTGIYKPLYEIEKKANDFEVEFKKILNNFDLLY
jgi:hypothetical protein